MKDNHPDGGRQLTRARLGLGVIAAGLIISGATCYFLPWELDVLVKVFHAWPLSSLAFLDPYRAFILDTRTAVGLLVSSHPQMFLGTDYLGFAHILLGVLFIGALRDPRRNLWVIDFGILACVAVVPSAFLFGALRDVPLIHSCIDASFGLIPLPLMILARRAANK